MSLCHACGFATGMSCSQNDLKALHCCQSLETQYLFLCIFMYFVISMGLETIKPCLKILKQYVFEVVDVFYLASSPCIKTAFKIPFFTVTNMLSFILILNRLIDDEILKRCPQGLHDMRVQSCVFDLGLVQVMTSLSSRV